MITNDIAQERQQLDSTGLVRSLGATIGRIAVVVGTYGHVLVSATLILALTYILGRTLLVDRIGNEGPLHVTYATWIADNYGDVPNWFPLQGAGMSIQRTYPLLGHHIVVLLSKLGAITLVEAFRIVSFISMAAAAMSIYLLGWVSLRSQTIGLISAVFFLLSPMSWWYQFEHGWIAVTVGLVALPLAILCFDRYLQSNLNKRDRRTRRLWFIGALVTFGFAALGHMFVGAGAAITAILFVFFLAAVSRAGSRWHVLRTGALSLLAVGGATLLLLSFWLVPMLDYTRIANSRGSEIADAANRNLFIDELISLSPLGEAQFAENASFPISIVILAFVGLVLSGFSSRRIFALLCCPFLVLITSQATEARVWLADMVPMLNFLIGYRGLLLMMTVLIPAAAGFGAWALAKLLFSPLFFLLKGRRQSWRGMSGIYGPIHAAAVAGVAVVVAFFISFVLRNVSSEGPEFINYGPLRAGFSIKDIWTGPHRLGKDAGTLEQQLAIENWPSFEVASTDSLITRMKELAQIIPDLDLLRFDTSPYLGQLAQGLSTYSSASQYGTYRWPANLNLSLTGYMANVLFTDSPPEIEYGTPEALNEVSNWCGCEFVLLNPEYDARDIYEKAGWELTYEDAKLEIWRRPQTPSLASVSNRPTILHVGYSYAFENLFRAAGRGAIPYDEAWLISGDELVDHYSISELLQFDLLLLYGYNYKNQEESWDLLGEYVQQGGSLFIDTGWQWQVPDWEMENAPLVLPVKKTVWTNYGVTADYRLESPVVGTDLNVELFGPLEWNGQPWSVSGVRREDVRDWGQVVLSASNQPLIVAGEFGAGRVVWSGMNLLSHAIDKNSTEEFLLLHSLISWMLDARDVADYSVNVQREHSDRIRFQFEGLPRERTWLLWRESTYPAWHAYLATPDGNRSELPIYQAGPGFTLIPIENSVQNATVDLIWETPLIERFAAFISVTTGLVLVVTMLFPNLWSSILFRLRS